MLPQLRYVHDGDGILLTEEFHVVIAGQRISIPAHFRSDGATIPRPLWPIIGKPLDAEYLRAAVVHDYYCDRANLLRRMALANRCRRLFRVSPS